jgi:hypothetical protein
MATGAVWLSTRRIGRIAGDAAFHSIQYYAQLAPPHLHCHLFIEVRFLSIISHSAGIWSWLLGFGRLVLHHLSPDPLDYLHAMAAIDFQERISQDTP